MYRKSGFVLLVVAYVLADPLAAFAGFVQPAPPAHAGNGSSPDRFLEKSSGRFTSLTFIPVTGSTYHLFRPDELKSICGKSALSQFAELTGRGVGIVAPRGGVPVRKSTVAEPQPDTVP